LPRRDLASETLNSPVAEFASTSRTSNALLQATRNTLHH
jgi:hypothetical protein